ncbi:MAG: FtsW/RodA/SpoVE family cell cycle protein [Oscillospiraceae bacterium]|nr:FtsW/RodA/SpoVE family cell cycle protein [Oscillospiraceae bacterium]
MEEMLQQMVLWLQQFAEAKESYVDVYTGFLRYAAPALAFILLWRCLKPLLFFKREPEIWAWLHTADGSQYALTHWENVIGRSKSSDVRIDFSTVSRNHAVFTRYDDGSWTVTDANSKGGVMVNGQRVKICALEEDDVINIGGLDMTLVPITKRQESLQAQLRTKGASGFDSVANLLLLTIFQCLCCIGFLLGGDPGHYTTIIQGFGGIMLAQWILFIFYAIIRRSAFEVETVAFFLCTMGMAALASIKPAETGKQLLAMYLGIAVFLTVGWSMRDLERAKKFRYLAVILGIGFLVFTLVFGEEQFGAKAWVKLAGMTLQPSELSKVCFVYAGASAMDRLMNKRNLFFFILYSIAICGCLALMNDFGTALIFFVAFLVIAYMRSGSVGTVGLACTALGFAGVIAVKIAPHALRRFTVWRHIWEDPYGLGYQQTRAIMCIASGGLFGIGAGRGLLKNVFAADSDIVFASISEEWGLIMACMLVLSIVALALFCLRSASMARSSFYTIGAITASAVMLTQVILNCLGTVDVVPLTGVTFPFLSNGGSSMIGAWGLLAFIKAADTRQNASFAVRLAKKVKGDACDE